MLNDAVIKTCMTKLPQELLETCQKYEYFKTQFTGI